jgi:hypothetical protein
MPAKHQKPKLPPELPPITMFGLIQIQPSLKTNNLLEPTLTEIMTRPKLKTPTPNGTSTATNHPSLTLLILKHSHRHHNQNK